MSHLNEKVIAKVIRPILQASLPHSTSKEAEAVASLIASQPTQGRTLTKSVHSFLTDTYGDFDSAHLLSRQIIYSVCDSED